MKITYNSLIKLFISSLGIWLLCLILYKGLYQNVYIQMRYDNVVVLNFWGLMAIVFFIIGLVLFLVQMCILCKEWADGEFNNILEKPIFKGKKKSFLAILNDQLQIAIKAGDVEEIKRIKNSIDIYSK